ncbi:GNAT family N-acetyltransferase [Neorhizobium sp. BT27B]|uniref:GNAT family N-acetyltransferase n=1 Tax=Neorhizobium sp. BT27B TaxID=3142625 RepID=UPI003D27413E
MARYNELVEISVEATMRVREAHVGDLAEVLNLMRRHAETEAYRDDFSLDETALRLLGFGVGKPAYRLLVSETLDGKINGYALYFLQEFTFRNRPLLYLNDLMVDERHRRKGVAAALIRALYAEAWSLGCFRIKWGVASDNPDAIAFYENIGAQAEQNKLYFILDVPGSESN